jgi:hypothetical protein
MPRGAPPGGHPGAGRPRGSKDKPRQQLMEQGLALLEEHISPLDIMKAAMLRLPLSNGELVDAQQFAAAVALAPYVHPKLNAIMVKDVTDSAPPPPPMLSVADIVAMARKPASAVIIEIEATATSEAAGVDSTDATP